MGKTADLTVVQKTTIDTLHKEGVTTLRDMCLVWGVFVLFHLFLR